MKSKKSWFWRWIWVIFFVVAVTYLTAVTLGWLRSVPATPTRDPLIADLATQVANLVAQQAATPTATLPPIATPTQPAAPAVFASSEWVPYDQAGGIPYNGTTWAVDVAPDEIEVLTAGPATIAGVTLPGGVDRGTIIIMLPASDVVVHYTITGLIAGSNWHGSYRPVTDPSIEATWRSLAEDRIEAMQIAPNCTFGKGCVIIDVLVIGPGNKVIAQWTIGQ